MNCNNNVIQSIYLKSFIINFSIRDVDSEIHSGLHFARSTLFLLTIRDTLRNVIALDIYKFLANIK